MKTPLKLRKDRKPRMEIDHDDRDEDLPDRRLTFKCDYINPEPTHLFGCD